MVALPDLTALIGCLHHLNKMGIFNSGGSQRSPLLHTSCDTFVERAGCVCHLPPAWIEVGLTRRIITHLCSCFKEHFKVTVCVLWVWCVWLSSVSTDAPWIHTDLMRSLWIQAVVSLYVYCGFTMFSNLKRSKPPESWKIQTSFRLMSKLITDQPKGTWMCVWGWGPSRWAAWRGWQRRQRHLLAKGVCSCNRSSFKNQTVQ